MRVFHSTNGKVQGGRQMEAAIAVAGEAVKRLSPHGGQIRFLLAGVAGEEVNGTVFSQESESPEALATAFDVLNDDVELQALLARLNVPGSPTEITSQSMGMEMSIGTDSEGGTAAASSRSTRFRSTLAAWRTPSPRGRRVTRSWNRTVPSTPTSSS